MDWTIGPLDHWNISLDHLLDHFFTIFWTKFWTILSGGGRLIYNSSDFIVSTYAKLGTNEIYQNPIVSINSKDGNQLYFLLQIS